MLRQPKADVNRPFAGVVQVPAETEGKLPLLTVFPPPLLLLACC